MAPSAAGEGAETEPEAGEAGEAGGAGGAGRRPRRAATPEPADLSASREAAEEREVRESPETPAAPEGATAPARRRRRRGGRGRGRGRAGTAPPEGPEAEGPEAAGPEAAGPEAAGEGPAPEAARAVRREGAAEAEPAPPRRRRARRAVVTEPAGAPAPAEVPEGEAVPSRRRRARRAVVTEPVEAPAGAGAPAAVEEELGGPTRTRKRRLPGRRRREAPIVVPREADKLMLVTELDERDQIAVVQDRVLVEHYITRTGARSMVGNIFLGKVQNVLPGMEAAFIDVGRGRNAVLYAGEVSYDEEIDGHAPRIEHVLRNGQNVVVQVTKDPIGGKGARLTQEISLPGRFVVFVPNSQTFGISRRLPDKERQRLKEILRDVKPDGHGLIVRTAAEGASAEDLQADLARLTATWTAIEKSAKRGKAPRALYEEPELTVRVVRDLFNEAEFREIVTDSRELRAKIVEYLDQVAPELKDKVRMHEGPLPVLEAHHVTEQIHKALDRKVWLPSGGYIVIDRTEAMTVVDVNTGKHVGKQNLEETVTKTNLEAAEEIARQLRLRDIGGMILVDFIDMLLDKNKDKVVQTMRRAMAQDKTRSQVFDISPLGILEITRKRVSAGLLESFSQTCPMCEGRGILLTHKV